MGELRKAFVNGVLSDIFISDEEIDKYKAEQTKVELMEKYRPLTESEISRMLITEQINALTVDDNTALRMTKFYPDWQKGKEYKVGFKVQRSGKLWRVRMAHTSQVGWEPENTPTLYETINETHSGTKEDPIPYDGNLALEQGMYYVQDWIIYLCTRDTINPVYHPLIELVGIYVEVAI